MTTIAKPMTVVIFRNDDLSAPSEPDHEKRLADMFDRHGVPQTLGVIPVCATDSYRDPYGKGHAALDENPAIVDFLRDYVARSGSEIALHGYYHRTNLKSRPRKREYFEFRAISLEEQSERIRRGTELLERCLGVRPRTFIPPWNRLDANTVRACAENGYDIVSAGPFTEVPDGMYSLGTDADLDSLPPRVEAAQRTGRLVFIRIMLHSRTMRTREDIACLERALRVTTQTPDCVGLTIAEAVRRYGNEVRRVNEAARNVVSQDEVPGTARARALVYQHVARRVGRPRALLRTFAAAHDAYDRGEYEEAARLTPTLDRLCRGLLLAGRSLAAFAGLAAGVVLAYGAAAAGWAAPAPLYVAAGLFAALGGLFLWWHGTAPDTKREIRTAVLCLIVFGAVGVALGHWAGAAPASGHADSASRAATASANR